MYYRLVFDRCTQELSLQSKRNPELLKTSKDLNPITATTSDLADIVDALVKEINELHYTIKNMKEQERL